MSASNEILIAAERLTIDYRADGRWLNAVCETDLQIAPGEIHGLVGESGSGKSTLALGMMRYLAANARASGRVSFDGSDLLTKPDDAMQRIWGKQIALVPQDALASLNPSQRIGDQIAEVARLHDGLSASEANTLAVEMLRRVRFSEPEDAARRYPHQLSGGMQQRASIAMALIARPRLLILDEPTTSLDVTTEAAIIDLIRDLIRDTQAAALFVTHNLGIVAQLCDRMTVLYAGEIMASGAVADLFARPLHPYTIQLLASLPRPTHGTETRLPTIEGVAPSPTNRPTGCVFAPRCPAAIAICGTKPPVEALDGGRLIKCHRWREIAAGTLTLEAPPIQPIRANDAPTAGYTLTTRDLRKTFARRGMFQRRARLVAVDDVSLQVRARSTLGLVGESGSGKTTAARLIAGLEMADAGTMELLDVPLANGARARPVETLQRLQMIFQNPNDSLNPYRSVGATLQRAIYRLSTAKLSSAEINARVMMLLESVRLPANYADRYPSELSGGEKQRVAIARAFAADPALVVADEPTSALDASVQSAVLNLLKDLRAERGVSYLFISHDLNAVAYLADWIAVMYRGEIVEEGDVEQVYNPPSHPYTEALLSAIPNPDPPIKTHRILLNDDANGAQVITGCPFHPRCPRKIGAICEHEAPPYRDAGAGHFIRCHIPVDELTVLQTSAPTMRTGQALPRPETP
ncbi:MAG: ABC transporter ATP-binding protein [Chloroflexota bacterium]|nr:ABC transporter ATP-binding protein [Chloroflexota bacterium]